ncbi:SoxR reducing system RseC family protein [Fervidobacterium sp. 2310opik-2]|uniref:SoxR reducing system RseC family protein n=1 Tax=Fervidobacterium sp. 2310opik-2 TaxID=1755815 RepID=UPI0013E05775|nr:SoxR reducing system RseC family protein [Fervidobacterium sp. 2310opik-2]KAF2962232.1 Fis family transcriptional regulator [Fervidobacterium sp. 2310opik-2]
MKELMQVRNVDDRYVYLTLMVNEVTCSACALSGTCSVKGNEKDIKIQKKSIKSELLPILPGDIVVVDLKYNEAVLSLIVYGIPLLGFIIGVLFSYLMKFSDIISFAVGIGFAGAGFLLTRLFDKKYKIEITDVKRSVGTQLFQNEKDENL